MLYVPPCGVENGIEEEVGPLPALVTPVTLKLY